MNYSTDTSAIILSNGKALIDVPVGLYREKDKYPNCAAPDTLVAITTFNAISFLPSVDSQTTFV